MTAFDTVQTEIAPCLGCSACGMDGPCVQKDSMVQLQKEILKADMMVWVAPLYYFGMSAQLKNLLRQKL
ncbi:NAD(P)H-dependent oxidoreductase [Diplocloster agilis]|uniref:flavodoxin family protein n=1 Tax=Diplocloster agilis TaxID=2850323 RepID=UPI00130E3FD0